MLNDAKIHPKIPAKSLMEGLNVGLVFRQGSENEACQNVGLHKYSRLPRSGSDRLSIM